MSDQGSAPTMDEIIDTFIKAMERPSVKRVLVDGDDWSKNFGALVCWEVPKRRGAMVDDTIRHAAIAAALTEGRIDKTVSDVREHP